MNEKEKKELPSESDQRDEVLDGSYANVFQVVFSPADFVMDFGRAVPGRQNVKLVSRIIISPLHVKQLALSLTDSVRRYEEQFGPIASPHLAGGDASPGFKQ